MTWHYAKDGLPAGPVSHEEMLRLIATHALAPDDLVWTDGMDAWRPARGVAGLFAPPDARNAPVFSAPTGDVAGPMVPAEPAPGFRGGGFPGGVRVDMVAPAPALLPVPPPVSSYTLPETASIVASRSFPADHNDQGYFSVEGRANRMRYFLQTIGPTFGIVILTAIMNDSPDSGGGSYFFVLLGWAVTAFPLVRRMHDLGWSGWVALLSLVPGLNFVVGIAALFAPGTVGPNEYGPDPLAPRGAPDSATLADPWVADRWAAQQGVVPSVVGQEAGRGADCPVCGHFVPTDSKFCFNCNTRVR
ncbi:MAG TPA: DUF805 domain-containing protein [Rhodothermales bacterium]|nr:DUF805 domain-containing protein [Rhodothermales bacterium]